MDPIQELEQLRKRVAELTAERDQLKQLYLLELARNAPEITQGDVDAAEPLRPWLDGVIRELEAE